METFPTGKHSNARRASPDRSARAAARSTPPPGFPSGSTGPIRGSPPDCACTGLRPHCEPLLGVPGPGPRGNRAPARVQRCSGTGWSSRTRPAAGAWGPRAPVGRRAPVLRALARGLGQHRGPLPSRAGFAPSLGPARGAAETVAVRRRWPPWPARRPGGVTAGFAALAKHYGVGVDLCPPRHGNRKGSVEKANHRAAQRWWRTLPDTATVAAAQASLDGFCARVGDTRARRRDGQPTTVAALASRPTTTRPERHFRPPTDDRAGDQLSPTA